MTTPYPVLGLDNCVATATGSSTARTIANRLADTVNVKDFGAVGDGSTDDSAAIIAAINRSNTLLGAGTPAIIYFPAGIYKIVTTLPVFTRGGSIIGDGVDKTWIKVDAAYAGDVFSWTESWDSTQLGTPTIDIANAKPAPLVMGISIAGSTAAASTTNAFRFYDRVDDIVMRDVYIYNIAGNALSFGRTLNQTVAYTRESFFENIHVWHCGTASLPAVEISSAGATADGTNQLDFYKLAIFSSTGVGLSIGNASVNAVRAIRFYGLRSEGNVSDAVKIGLTGDTGQVANIAIYNLYCPGIATGTFGLNIDGGAVQTYGITVVGGALIGSGKAFNVGNARLVDLSFANLAVTDTVCTYAGGTSVKINGNGDEANWTTNLTTDRLTLKDSYYLFGSPQGSNVVGTYTMQATATSTTAVRLTTDNSGTATAANCFNPLSGSIYQCSITLIAIDSTSKGNYLSWYQPACLFATPFGTPSVTPFGTLATNATGTGVNCTVALSADTTNKGYNLSFTPPAANTDTWHISARIDFVKVS